MLKYQVRSGTLTRQQSAASNNLGPATAYDEVSSLSSRGSSAAGAACLRCRPRSASVSSLSSADSAVHSAAGHHDSPVEWGTAKIYTGALRPDTDYKTLFMHTAMTSREVVRSLLAKFRLQHKDPKLFYLVLELRTRVPGGVRDTLLELDDWAHPLALQRCHPASMSRLVLRSRPDGRLLRIHDGAIDAHSNYKSVLVSNATTVSETVQLLLHTARLPYAPSAFVLVAVHPDSSESFLPPDACIVSHVDSCGTGSRLHIRPFAAARRVLSGCGAGGTRMPAQCAQRTSTSSSESEPASPERPVDGDYDNVRLPQPATSHKRPAARTTVRMAASIDTLVESVAECHT